MISVTDITVGAPGAMSWCLCGGTNSPTFLLSIVCLMVVNKPDHCEVITFSTAALLTESQEKHTFENEYNPFTRP